MHDINVFSEVDQLNRAVAWRIKEMAEKAMAARGKFNLVLSGGSSPAGVYELLGRDGTGKSLDWSRVRLFWGDERLVEYDDARSNYGLARRLFIDRVPLRPENIFPMPVDSPPFDAARTYARDLARAFDRTDASGPPPVFDLILLGLGPDGHIASLFPNRPAVAEEWDWVAAETEPGLEPKTPRLSLTLPVINQAAEILFLAHGPGKASVIKLILDQVSGPNRLLPAARVTGPAAWYLDAKAAELIGGYLV